MADTTIKMPTLSASMETPEIGDAPNVESTKQKIEKVMEEQLTDNYSDVYHTMMVNSIPEGIKPKLDFATGGKRNPRWGMVVSFSMIPELDKNPVGPIILPTPPYQFVTADDLETIKERVIFELDKVIKLSQIAADDPEGYARYQNEMYQSMIQDK